MGNDDGYGYSKLVILLAEYFIMYKIDLFIGKIINNGIQQLPNRILTFNEF